MPAKKIIDAVASTLAVIGSSMATASGRADAGQHAHGRAQRAADKGPQQVDRRARRGKALQKLVPDVHHSDLR